MRPARNVLLAAVAMGWIAEHGVAAAAATLSSTTVHFTNGVSVAFSTGGQHAVSSSQSGSLAMVLSADAVVRAFTDLEACTYFGYELRAKPLGSSRIEVSLGPLSPRGEERVRQDFDRQGCPSAHPLTAQPPRFPPPRAYASGEGLSIALLSNSRTGARIEDRIQVSLTPGGRLPETSRAQIEVEIESLRERMQELESELLATGSEDRSRFQAFLREPDTGLVRLLPRERYESKLTIRGGGAYYSFVKLSHSYNDNAQLELQRGEFSTGFAGADFGFLVRLGDTAIEDITAEHPGVRFLANYAPPTAEPQARKEQHQMNRGVKANGFSYGRSLPATVGMTYALRAICYRESDVLVAFRVLRQDDDGSVILLWKILKRYPTPQLEREPSQAPIG